MLARLMTFRPVNLYWLCAILLTLVVVGCGGTSGDGGGTNFSRPY